MIDFYVGDTIEIMKKLSDTITVDGVLTSPPYNMTKRKGGWGDKKFRYDEYRDDKDYDEYLEWTKNIFNTYDRIIKPNGVVLYNFSYSIENPSFPYELVAHILNNTNFMVADTIMWKNPILCHILLHQIDFNVFGNLFLFLCVKMN